MAHIAVRMDIWAVLQKVKPSYCVKADGTIDLFREQKIVKTSSGIMSIKIFIGYVGRIPQNVTFTCC